MYTTVDSGLIWPIQARITVSIHVCNFLRVKRFTFGFKNTAVDLGRNVRECVNYYMLLKEFSDMMSMYALNRTKLSFGVIINDVYYTFAGICCDDT